METNFTKLTTLRAKRLNKDSLNSIGQMDHLSDERRFPRIFHEYSTRETLIIRMSVKSFNGAGRPRFIAIKENSGMSPPILIKPFK